MLQDGGGYLELAGYSPAGGVQTKLAEKRKLIEEIAHNDVKKVSFSLFWRRKVRYLCTEIGKFIHAPVVV